MGVRPAPCENIVVNDQPTDPYGVMDRAALQAIGVTVVAFSQLEDLLSLAVNCLIVGTRPDESAQFLLTRLQFRALLDSFSGLYIHRFGNGDSTLLKRHCKDMEKVNDERNHLVHALWYPGDVPDQLTRYRTQLTRSGAKKSDESVNETSILELAVRITDLHSRFATFVAERIIDRIDGVVAKI